ncbi:MAG: hypothetical protein AAFW70_08040 [Cyanobacteria bacterium J06635_10]
MTLPIQIAEANAERLPLRESELNLNRGMVKFTTQELTQPHKRWLRN